MLEDERTYIADLCEVEPPEPKKPSKHDRLKPQYRHLRMSADVRAKAHTRRDIVRSPIDPELANIVATVRRGVEGKPLPAKEQSRAWLHARDVYAEKNRDLARRAAEKQWQRNQHLEREKVRCCGACARCRNRNGWRMCQPDLEQAAYIGLLEAIRCFDREKATCISSYAVHTMKQQMMMILRQTPVFYPQELLRDRRELAAETKRKKADLTEEEQNATLLRVRKCRRDEDIHTRRQLAVNCYYGQDKQSVEVLQQKYVERADRNAKRTRLARMNLEGLITAPVDYDVEDHDLRGALAALPLDLRNAAEKFLRGRGDLPEEALAALREEML